MKEVIVVGSVNRNARNVVLRTVRQLIASQHRVWISDSFNVRGLEVQLKTVPGLGNIAKRLAKWNEGKNLLSSRFYVCVLPYHGEMTKHELDTFKKLKVIKFMRVFSDGSIHDCKLREVLETVPGCDPLSIHRAKMEFDSLEV